MRTLGKFLMLFALCAGIAHAEPVVTVTGSVNSLDSSHANVLISTNSRKQLIVLPANVVVRLNGPRGAVGNLSSLTPGTRLVIDCDKAASGQLTARRVIVMSSDGVMPQGAPPPANQVTIRPASSNAGGVSIRRGAGNSGSTSSTTSASVFSAVRAMHGGSPTGEVRVNDHTVFRFRAVKGTPYARATEVVRRLNSASMSDLRAGEVTTVRVGGSSAVQARGHVLIVADAGSARVNQTTSANLAAMWAQNLRAQLAS